EQFLARRSIVTRQNVPHAAVADAKAFDNGKPEGTRLLNNTTTHAFLLGAGGLVLDELCAFEASLTRALTHLLQCGSQSLMQSDRVRALVLLLLSPDIFAPTRKELVRCPDLRWKVLLHSDDLAARACFLNCALVTCRHSEQRSLNDINRLLVRQLHSPRKLFLLMLPVEQRLMADVEH